MRFAWLSLACAARPAGSGMWLRTINRHFNLRAHTHTHTQTKSKQYKSHTHTFAYLQPSVICLPDSYRPRTCRAFATTTTLMMAMIMMRHIVLALALLLVTLTATGKSKRGGKRERERGRAKEGETNTLLTHIFYAHVVIVSTRFEQLGQLAALNAIPSTIRNAEMILNQMT